MFLEIFPIESELSHRLRKDIDGIRKFRSPMSYGMKFIAKARKEILHE